MFRRCFLCAMALLMTLGSARAASMLCIDAPGVVALTDAAGKEIIENGRYETIFSVRQDALYAAGSRGSYALFDASGNRLGDIDFSMIDDEGETLVYRSGGLYGAMDASGNPVLPAEWNQLTASGDGGWLALDDDPLDETPDEIIYIDASGEPHSTGIYTASGLQKVSCGRMPYMNGDGLWGALGARGGTAIACAWLHLGPFVDGVARASGPRGVGMIDVSGREVVPVEYEWLDRSAALVAAFDGDGVDIYGPRGGQRRFRVKGPVLEVAVVGSCVSVANSEAVRLYDARGKQLLKTSAGTTYAPGTRGQMIAVNGEWGDKCQRLIGPDGRVASGRFQQLLPLCAGRYAFLDMDGIEYYSMELDRTQRSWDYGDRLYGLMDASGRILLEAEYYEIRALSDDRLLLVGDGEVELTDRNGVSLQIWFTPEREAPIGEAGE